jgi:hypothetical protein
MSDGKARMRTGHFCMVDQQACDAPSFCAQVTLVSSDSETFQVDEEVANQSITVKNLLEGEGPSCSAIACAPIIPLDAQQPAAAWDCQ